MPSKGLASSIEDVEVPQDLSKFKVDDLKAIAKKMGLVGYSSMNKEELIKLISSFGS